MVTIFSSMICRFRTDTREIDFDVSFGFGVKDRLVSF
jgi:hypothetical protein